MTLQRSPWLIAVLTIHPLLTILAVLEKATLYNTPIGDSFGLILLLAGIREEELEVLRGAALSSQPSRRVRVHFTARKAKRLEHEGIHLDLGSPAKSDRLNPKIKRGRENRERCIKEEGPLFQSIPMLGFKPSLCLTKYLEILGRYIQHSAVFTLAFKGNGVSIALR